MRWTERQQAMLREMGIGPWQREPAAASDVAATVAGPAVVSTAPQAADARPRRPPDSRPEEAPGAGAGAERREPGESTEAAPWPAADWLVIGELPAGESAAAEAQLLDNLMRAIGRARDAPARSGRFAFLAVGEGSADSALKTAVAGVQPRCILALGRSAALALLGGDEPLGALRAAEHRRSGVPVAVTCSLAFLLRHADEKARVWAELCRAVRALEVLETEKRAG
ncbi:MAG: hypothetical protein ABIO71_05325 [Caldimonas sp.]